MESILSTEQIHNNIANNLKRALDHLGLSITEAARLSGISRSCISNTINRKSRISAQTFATICRRLDISGDFLWATNPPIEYVNFVPGSLFEKEAE